MSNTRNHRESATYPGLTLQVTGQYITFRFRAGYVAFHIGESGHLGSRGSDTKTWPAAMTAHCTKVAIAYAKKARAAYAAKVAAA